MIRYIYDICNIVYVFCEIYMCVIYDTMYMYMMSTEIQKLYVIKMSYVKR